MVSRLVLPSDQDLSFDTIATAFDWCSVERHPIECVNWQSYPDRPLVEFAIAHTDEMIYVLFNVKESSMRATYTADSDSRPCDDSCVEFFISMDNSRKEYYNIECNAIGALMLKSGDASLPNRTRHNDSITSQIQRYTTLAQGVAIEAQEGEFSWSLIMAIPTELLGIESGSNLSGHKAAANFYKCGDKLPRAHYLSWSPIDTPEPNFHCPEFFGNLIFE